MDVHEVRRARLKQLLGGMSAAELSRRSGVAATLITRYLYEPATKGAKNLGEQNARKIETAAGKPPGWLDRQHSSAGRQSPEVAQILSQVQNTIRPITMQWELILITDELPKEFTLPVRDDAMTPRLVRGGLAHCSTAAKHGPRDLVLIADSDGELYIREYAELTPTHWRGVAAQPGYLPLDSREHGLRVLAKVVGGWWG